MEKSQTTERTTHMQDIKVYTKRGNSAVIVDGKPVAAYDVERMEWYKTNEPLSDEVVQFLKNWMKDTHPFIVSSTQLKRYTK